MEQSDDREVSLLLVSGTVLPFTRRELRHAMGSRIFHAALCLGGFFWLGLLVFWSGVNDPVALLISFGVVLPLSIVLTYVAYFGTIEVILAFSGKNKVLIPEALISLFVTALVVPFQLGLSLVSGHGPFGSRDLSFANVLFHFGAMQTTVLGYAHFLRPIVNADMVPRDEPPAPDPPPAAAAPLPILRIADLVTTIDTLETIEARDHYVAILSRTGEAETRGRLKDVIEQLSSVPGRQIHRSVWVHDAAVAGATRKKDGIWLILRSGREVKVARPRQTETEAWLRARGIL